MMELLKEKEKATMMDDIVSHTLVRSTCTHTHAISLHVPTGLHSKHRIHATNRHVNMHSAIGQLSTCMHLVYNWGHKSLYLLLSSFVGTCLQQKWIVYDAIHYGMGSSWYSVIEQELTLKTMR